MLGMPDSIKFNFIMFLVMLLTVTMDTLTNHSEISEIGISGCVKVGYDENTVGGYSGP